MPEGCPGRRDPAESNVAPRATASRGALALTRSVATLCLLALLGGCSDRHGARGGAGIRIGARDAAPGDDRYLARGRARAGRVLELVDSHESGQFNRGGAEIVDFHPGTRRVFVVSSKAARVTVLKLGARGFERGEDALEPGRDVAGFNAGQVTSLAVSGDLVAVAVRAAASDGRGRVAFYSAEELDYLAAVEVGYGPDMLTFTPDGGALLVANEGEQVRNADERIVSDPEGSVTIIDLSHGARRAEVTEVTFRGFDARVEALRNAGVRVPRLGGRFFESGDGHVTPSRDLEPEYIAVASDGARAWVTLQENDAIAVLDLKSRAFVDILPLGVKDFSVGSPAADRLALPHPLPRAASHAVLGSSRAALVRVGARSAEPVAPVTGLWFDALDSRPGRQVFHVVRDGAIEALALEHGRLEHAGEAVVPELAPAAGFRGLVRDPSDRTFWLGGAADGVVYHLSPEGRPLHAFPLDGARRGGPKPTIVALALDAPGRRLFVLHEAEPRPGVARLARVRVLNVDPLGASFGAARGEHLYMSDAPASSGAAPGLTAAVYAGDDRLLVLEQDGAAVGEPPGPAQRVFRVALTGAQDVLGVDTGSGKPLEACSADELYTGYGLTPLHKQRLHSLPAADAPRLVRGVALLEDAALAVLAEPSPLAAHGAPPGGEAGAAALEIVSFDEANRFDASDRDGKAALRRWPVLGRYMPDGIGALRVAGRDYFVTANEGDTRQYDARRLSEVELDAGRFPEAAALQSSAALGRLKVSTLDGDLDADGDLDDIYAFGARSVSVWDAAGNRVADTGSLLEEVTALAGSEAFNSNNDGNGTFDTRSDDRGPEPEGLELAEINGRSYAFVGLERVGGIVVLDLTDPHGVSFVEYVNPRDFAGSAARGQARDLGPEGLRFVPAPESPTGRGLLLVGNEVSGTTSVYDVNL